MKVKILYLNNIATFDHSDMLVKNVYILQNITEFINNKIAGDFELYFVHPQ